MTDRTRKSQGTQPPPTSARGHPMPRRATPEKSVTLRNHHVVRGLSKAEQAAAAVSGPTITTESAANAPKVESPCRNSSGESRNTSRSDPKRWFDSSNRNPTAAFDSAMDLDEPPFFQKETDSSDDPNAPPAVPESAYPFAHSSRQLNLTKPTVTHSSSADDYRSVIDDLTIENQRLKEELKRYRQFGPDLMKRDKLFEIKVHGLPKRKKRELESTLRDFAASLAGSSESPSSRKKTTRHQKGQFRSGETFSKHASSSSSNSRPVDSAYASASTGPNSSVPNFSSTSSLGRPSLGRAKSSDDKTNNPGTGDTPTGLLPRHMVLTDKEKKKLVVKRLEQLFTGKISGRSLLRSQISPPVDGPSPSVALRNQASPPVDSLIPISIETLPLFGPHLNPEAAREARIQPHEAGKKGRSRDNLSASNSNGDQTESGGNGNGDGCRSGGGGNASGNNPSPPTVSPPEQRPTRAADLDPDRAQVPSENIDYIRHLGLVPPEFLVEKKAHYQDVSPDADGWVYLNLLANLAQLHMMNVTPNFIRSAVSEKSAKFQLSPDGRKIRWRGGTDGTRFSTDSSGENSQRSPSDSDGSNEVGQRKKQKTTSGDGTSSKESKFGPQASTSTGFHYKPLFVHQSSSLETSLEESNSSFGAAEDSAVNNSHWALSGSGSSPRKKRRHDGAIVYYNGAPFCIDLSGDPGDVSSNTYLTSSRQDLELEESFRPHFHRSQSGSHLPIRPLSDDPAIVSEAMDMDLDNIPDLVKDDNSLTEGDCDFPWCDKPEEVYVKTKPITLEPCGLGGVMPDDHFAVIVTTRRPILRRPRKDSVLNSQRAISEDTTESIAGRIASMTTSSPTPSRPPMSSSTVEIVYLSGRLCKFNPVPLPPPALFYPPFSSDSDDDEEEALETNEDDGSEESTSEHLISQRANPHQSDNTNPVDGELSGNDEEDEVDNDGYESEESEMGQVKRPADPQRFASASTGRRPALLHTRAGSSVATAGGKSRYSSSPELE